MDKNPTPLRFPWALWFVLLCGTTGNALATPTFGVRYNNYCALQPIQAAAPQQSRPYQAAGSACSLCHTTGNPSRNDLDARGTASRNCTGSGTATVCSSAMNIYCVASAPSNASITAPAAGASIAQGQSFTFTAANATNPDGFPLSYIWLFSSGQANASGQSVAVPMSVAGAVTATLQVRNSVGMLAATTPTRAVTVTGAANQAPVATISAPAANASIARGATVSFQGSGSDPDNNLPLTYAWSFPGGTPASSTAQNPGAVTYATAGSFTASFTVRDSQGLASTAVTRNVTVTAPANQAPVATINAPAANVSIARGATVSFQGSGSDSDNNLPLTYAWSFPGGTPASSTAQNPGAVTYGTAGTFTATLTVRDSLGLASTAAARSVTVNAPGNQAPVATISAPAANVSIARGATASFQGAGSDPDNNLPLTYAWSFPGGTPASSTAQNPGTVTFGTAGSFTATFTVRDSLGLASAAATRTITVNAPANQAPGATINAPAAASVSIAQGGTVSFQGTGSDADNNLPLTYAWSFPGGNPASSTVQNPGAVSYGTAGTFTASFTVRDSLGLASTTVTRTVTVAAPANQPPVATINAPTANLNIAVGGTASFQGSGSDPNNNLPLTYAWSFPGGSPSSSTAQNPGAVSYGTAGSFTASFIVTDSLGLASAPVTRTVTVATAANQPVAIIGAPAINVSILPRATVTFRGSGEGSTALPLSYRWRFAGGEPSGSTSQNPGAVRFSNVGSFAVTLTVTDRQGRQSATATRTITVAARNQAPPDVRQCTRDGDDDDDD